MMNHFQHSALTRQHHYHTPLLVWAFRPAEVHEKTPTHENDEVKGVYGFEFDAEVVLVGSDDGVDGTVCTASHKDKKYPTGTRTNRATLAGFWKATGRDKAVYDKRRLIGMRKTLVFYKGRAPNGQKSDWIMHEYRLESDENGPPQEEGWVVCRAFKKRATTQTRTNEGWDSGYFYEESSGVSSALDYIPLQSPNYFCKQEIEADNMNFLNSDNFVQLPHLDSPSLPLIKKPSFISLVSGNNCNEDEERIKACKNTEKVTDWRDLDKFVASQLSQEERFEGHGGVSIFGDDTTNGSDMALLLLQSSMEEEGKLMSGFLNSGVTSNCDIGICIFDDK
ncbi:hypothetical protein GIB67_004204 [Kingdonia uniflora]|uniref:NAC domain-containing protein n=1 Tax=Kingdonia uniflora TaxID=39325 RepID=A0A7J7P0Z9_9MAGN|nr:hypothetical protein GIB67_004204 [Kingdonia uniflora]